MRERVRVRMRKATCADEGVQREEDEGGLGGEVARVREANSLDEVRIRRGGRHSTLKINEVLDRIDGVGE